MRLLFRKRPIAEMLDEQEALEIELRSLVRRAQLVLDPIVNHGPLDGAVARVDVACREDRATDARTGFADKHNPAGIDGWRD